MDLLLCYKKFIDFYFFYDSEFCYEQIFLFIVVFGLNSFEMRILYVIRYNKYKLRK